MKVSLRWLGELVALEGRDAAAVAELLTGQGLEVEGIEPKGHELSGVVIAEVLAVRPHPNAEKLRLVRVRAGSREDEVVCGAPNVPPPGNKVCWAAPGARLPGARTIEPREIRGVLSPGMLCSEPEMGLGPQGDGILILSTSAPSGGEVVRHLEIADEILEVNVTPNRPDALSHLGIARELAAGWGLTMRLPALDEVPQLSSGPSADVQIADPEACPRYQARFIAGLTVGPSPLPMRLRLEYCGMRAISNLVDATNYVLLETGHPLHAFDFAKVEGGIRVRRASAGERLTTLDGQERQLLADDIVIADARGGVALAGVMGGASSEVSDSTRDVLLEAATFDPRSIRRTAKRLGLHSEASYRFERGVDAAGVPFAAARAAALMAKLGGGSLVTAVVDRYPRPAQPRRVTLTIAKLDRLSGRPHEPAQAAEKLRRLGFETEVRTDAIVATVPSFRPDVAIEEDLVEEVLRMGGYGGAPKRLVGNASSLPHPEAAADRARDLLTAAGLNEVITWAFVPRATLHTASGDGRERALADGVVVKNPISADYEMMRTSLLPGLAETARRNLSRGLADVGLFEVGPIVRKSAGGELPHESVWAAGILAGRGRGWLKPGEPLDFFDLKGVVENVLRGFGVEDAAYVAPAPAPYFHPGVSAEIRLGGAVGALGELDPVIARRLGLDARALYFELAVDALQRQGDRKSSPPPRFPAVTRDVSFWVDAGVAAAEVRKAFASAGEPLLRSVTILEDFRDPRHVPAGKKGLLWSMTYRSDERTLTDPEADAAHARVVKGLSDTHAIQIR